MISLVIALLTTAGIILTGYGVRGLFTKIAVRKEKRYKEKIIIIIMGLTFLLIALFNGIFTLWAFYNEDMKKVYDFFNDSRVTRLSCLGIILLWLIVKYIYAHIVNKKDDNVIGINERLPYLYYYKALSSHAQEKEAEKGYGYIVKSAVTYNKILKALGSFIVWFSGLYSGVQAYFSLTDNNINLNYIPITAMCLIAFLAEVAAYMDGSVEEEKLDAKRAAEKSDRNIAWVDLSDEYESIWKDKLLASYRIYGKSKKIYVKDDKLKGNHYSREIADFITSKDGNSSNFSNGRIISQILSGKNLIIESEIVINYTEALYPVINILFAANKKLIFLCDSQYTVNKCSEWLNDLQLKKDHGSIVVETLSYDEIEKEAKLDSNIDIYITTVELALKGKINYEDIDVVLGINTDRILSAEALNLTILSSIFKSNRTQDMQYILFSKRVNGLEQAISNVFMNLDFHYIVEEDGLDRAVTINFWSSERGWLQSNIISGYGASFMGQLIPLSMPALRRELYGVGIITSKEAYLDELNSVYKSQPMMKRYMHHKEIVNIDEGIDFYENGNFVAIKDNDLLILEDKDKNVGSCAYNWSGQGKKNLFVNIVSPQYLLRDYFIDNIDFFLGNSEASGAIMPVQHNNIKLAVFRIISELCRGMEEEKLLINLNRLGIDTDSTNSNINKIIIKALNKLTQEAFSVNISFDIYLKVYNESDDWQKEIFESKRYYKLLSSVINELPQRLFKNLKFIDSEKRNKVINTIPAYELYQNYLEGQYITIGGRYYLIERIDFDKAVVEVSYSTLLNNFFYRQKRIVSVGINSLEDNEPPSYSIRDSEFSQNIYRGEITIDTEGYYQFSNRITFGDGEYSYREINRRKRGLKRNYRNGNILEWKITSDRIKSNSVVDNFNLSFTFSLLLNEIFETLFPEVNQYIIARSVIKNKEVIHREAEIIHMYEPIICQDAKEDAITIFILEDTELEKGITKTIVNNMNSIIRLLFDYLLWLTDTSNTAENHDRWIITGTDDSIKVSPVDKYNFLRYGLDKIPEYIIPEKLLECLKEVVTKDIYTFSNHRIDFVNKRSSPIDLDSESSNRNTDSSIKKSASEYSYIEEKEVTKENIQEEKVESVHSAEKEKKAEAESINKGKEEHIEDIKDDAVTEDKTEVTESNPEIESKEDLAEKAETSSNEKVVTKDNKVKKSVKKIKKKQL
ncbi:hypothetical protein ACPWSR_02110 [Alloiococcus sp. CFN-8]|uniref:hypothetical protein n=1 Tax=Alloiococcus sp. CFN-8 TaxID=3416081 RepID=UPI003CE9C025